MPSIARCGDGEAEGTLDHPEYEAAITILNYRHVCRLDEWPASVHRSLDDWNMAVYGTIQGPNEFTFTGNDLGLIANICDRVVVMEQRRIVETAPIRKPVEAPSHPYTIKLISSQPETVTPGNFFALGKDNLPEPTALPKAAPLSARPLLDISSRKPATLFRAVDCVSL